MKYLLDTDHFSILQRYVGPDYQNLSARMERIPISEFAVSIVTVHEQFLGSNSFISRAQNPADIVKGYQFMEKLAWSMKTIPLLGFGDQAALIFSGFRSQRLKLATMDLRIASIAVASGLVLLTFLNNPAIRQFGWLSGKGVTSI